MELLFACCFTWWSSDIFDTFVVYFKSNDGIYNDKF